MNKTIAIVLAVIILAGGGYYIYSKNQAQAPDTESNMDNTNMEGQTATENPSPVPSGQTNTINNTSTPDHSPTAEGGETAAPDIQVVEIDYDGSKFTPASVNIKVNDWVFFKNTGTSNFWPASNPHPTHTDYPEFDSKKPIAPGGQFKFQFTKVGAWGFHNHFNPSAKGVVNVTQ